MKKANSSHKKILILLFSYFILFYYFNFFYFTILFYFIFIIIIMIIIIFLLSIFEHGQGETDKMGLYPSGQRSLVKKRFLPSPALLLVSRFFGGTRISFKKKFCNKFPFLLDFF